MLSHMIQPARILEIGTYTGYSALCMAEGLREDGKLITIDINEEIAQRTRGYFTQSRFASQIEMKTGAAKAIIPHLKEKWDLIFIDADKVSYQAYFDLTIDDVRPGGFIIADNVLWSGKVLDEEAKDEDTLAMRKFNQSMQQDTRVQNVLFPIRDGLMILRKRTRRLA